MINIRFPEYLRGKYQIMQIDRILYPIYTLGPGERLVLWTVGCSIRCYKCSNPELWEKNTAKNIEIENLGNLIKQAITGKKIDGITIIGGDPLEQIEELSKLLPHLNDITDDILLFTGYKYEDIKSLEKWQQIKDYISVLIDEPYIDELNDNKCVLRGSTNQNIIYLKNGFKEKYESYLSKGRLVQNVFYKDKMISVGIHNLERKANAACVPS